jgi:hypothetical protein
MRKTSIDCFNQITNEGLLSKCRLQVYKALYELGKPSTAREIFATMQLVKIEPTRLTELMNMGVIYEKSIRKCTITGRNVIEWDLTDNLPTDTKVPTNTKKDRVNNSLNALRELYKNKNTSTDADWKNVADLIKSI